MKKTLELTLCESEGVKIEVSCEVLRIETDNPAIHPDDPNQGTITEYWCKEIIRVFINGTVICNIDNISPIAYKIFTNLVESQLESNPELFNEG
mgnify:FL=1